MKQITFNVSITFSGKIQGDEEILEVANNISRSLTLTANTSGLAPNDAEISATSIEVTEPFSEIFVRVGNTL